MIKADGAAKVKVCLLLFAVCLAASRPLFADVSEKEVQNIESQEFGIDNSKKQPIQQDAQVPEPPPEDYQPGAEPQKAKSIEAEEFRVKYTKASHSGRVVMLEDASDNRPRPGKILLLKDDASDIAAIRVLKNYPGKFAAKVILPITELKTGTEYRALKKLGDKISNMIKEREKRGKDLDSAKTDEELAKEVSPDDNELDRGIPAPKAKGSKKVKDKPDGNAGPTEPEKKMPPPLFNKEGQEVDENGVEIKDDDEAEADVSVQEELPLEPHRHIVSVQYGSMRSVDKDSNPASYSAIGVRYGFNIWRMPFFHHRSLQDMFTLELSLFYYTISGFSNPDDSITVYPLEATARYSLLFNENLTVYGYLGLIRNSVSQNDGALTANLAALATTRAALGLGAMLKIGPSWAARLDFGTDALSIGASLKF